MLTHVSNVAVGARDAERIHVLVQLLAGALMRLLLVSFLAPFMASPALAQGAASPMTPVAAFESFARVAATVGQPTTALTRLWPQTLDARGETAMLSLTAAHLLTVRIVDDVQRRDGVRRVASAEFQERVADTLVLRRRALELMRQIAPGAALPDRCEPPLGAPGYLFVPQRVARQWNRGLAGQSTQLVWEVGPGSVYVISVRVGAALDAGPAMLACDARLP